jgi:nitrate/TMAO reductase-like tetraheme cytochrome c subunit
MFKLPKYAKVAVAIFGLGLFWLAWWMFMPVARGDEAGYCARCHAMRPEVLTWEASGHSQFQCQVCHREPGLGSFFKYRGRLVREVLLYRTDSVPKEMKIKKPVPDSVCKECHAMENRRVSATSDTIIPHVTHEKQGVACVTCHAGVAHGRIIERGVTKKISPADWTPATANENMDFRYTTPRMEICLDCHGERRVSTTCSLCHSNYPIPASHKPAAWKTNHGLSARQDFKPCNLCHVYTLRQPVDLLNTTLPGYIRANSFCANCHLQKPESHEPADFRAIHGRAAKEKTNQNCFVCHDLSAPKTPETGQPLFKNKVYCNNCHWFKDKI